MIGFRQCNSIEAVEKIKDFLIADVRKDGGTATEVVNMHNRLMMITACKVPWGEILINQEVTRLEALAWWFEPID